MGSGLVTLGLRRNYKDDFHLMIDDDIFNSSSVILPELIKKLIISFKADFFNKYDGVLIGPGFGKNPKNKKLIKFLLKNYKKRLVIDADALNIIAENKKLKEMLFNISSINKDIEIVLTPHTYEAKRLFLNKENIGVKSENFLVQVTKNCLDLVNSNNNIVVVLKSNITRVFSSNALLKEYLSMKTNDISKNRFISLNYGTPALAVAGSGDVLAGIILSILGEKSPKKHSILSAAILGVKVHSKIGHFAEKKLGERSVIASDLINMIPFLFKN